jgi:hypothetical protein
VIKWVGGQGGGAAVSKAVPTSFREKIFAIWGLFAIFVVNWL